MGFKSKKYALSASIISKTLRYNFMATNELTEWGLESLDDKILLCSALPSAIFGDNGARRNFYKLEKKSKKIEVQV